MTTPTIDIRVNPADESIQLDPLAIRFLVTGEQSGGSVAAFEMVVPAGERLAAPAHSHDHYEETINGVEGVLTWTVTEIPSPSGRDRRCVFRAAPFTGSITTVARM